MAPPRERGDRWTLLCVGVILLWGCAPLLWFLPHYLIHTTDLDIPFTAQRWQWLAHTWNEAWGAGTEWVLTLPSLVSTAIPAALHAMTRSLELTQRLDFILWFTVPGLTMWCLMRYLTRDQREDRWVACLVAVNVYMFNLYLEALWLGNLSGLTAYAAFPLLLWMVFQGVESPRPVLWGLGFGVSSLAWATIGLNAEIALVVIMALAGVALFSAGRAAARGDRPQVIRTATFVCSAVVTTAACHAFWLFPHWLMYTSKTPVALSALQQESRSWLGGVSAYTSFVNVVRIQGAWTWDQGWNEPYHTYSHWYRTHPLSLAAGWALPLIVWIGLRRLRGWRQGYFGALAVVGIVFGMGTHPPMRGLYLWCIRHLPTFWIFRTPWYKFTLLTCLGYAVLAGVGVRYLYGRWASRRARRGLAVAAVAALLIGNMAYVFPVTLGTMFAKPWERKYLKPAHVVMPPYVEASAQWLDAQAGFFRTMCLHKHVNNMGVYDWGYAAFAPPLALFTRRPMLFSSGLWISEDRGSAVAAAFHEALYKASTSAAMKIARLLGVRYLLLENDLQYDYFEFDHDSPAFIRDQLRRQTDWRFSRQIGRWEWYEVTTPALPRWYAATGVTAVVGDLSAVPPMTLTTLLDGQPAFVLLKMAAGAPQWPAHLAPLVRTAVVMNQSGPVTGAPPWWDRIEDRYLMQSTEAFARTITANTALPSSDVQITEFRSLRPLETFPDGTRWRWLINKDEPAHVIVDNRTGAPVTTYCRLRALSYGRARDLFVYVNGELIEAILVPADTPSEVIPKMITLKPGVNAVRFYTPAESDHRGDERVNFAFEDGSIRFGRFELQGSAWIPTADAYDVLVACSPIRDQEPPTRVVLLAGSPVGLRWVGAGRWAAAKPVPLPAGALPVGFVQTVRDEQAYVLFHRAGPSPPASGPPPIVRATSKTSERYDVEVESARPALVVFNEAYHPQWRVTPLAGSTGVPAAHLLVNGFANGFIIDRPGRYHFAVTFRFQDVFLAGVTVTAAAASLALMIGLGVWWRGRRRPACRP